MTSTVGTKQGSHVDAASQEHTSPGAPLSFMGLCTEIRLMVYKEAFSESYVSEPLNWPEGSVGDEKDSKPISECNDANEFDFSDDRDDSGTSDDLGDSGETPGSLDDSDGVPDRLSFKRKLGLPLACKTICTEALPVLYTTHHFELTVKEEVQIDVDALKPAEEYFLYRYYFLRRNPTMVEHMTHVEILFDSNYDHSDLLYAGAHYLTISLLQKIAAACPKLHTFRFLTARFPQGWILKNDDPRSNIRRDTAIACFRNFAQNGCNLEFQTVFDTLAMEGFIDSVAPRKLKSWTLEWSWDLPYQLKKAESEHLGVWNNLPEYNLYRLPASTYQQIEESVSNAEDPSGEHSSILAVQRSSSNEGAERQTRIQV
ncbi:MAG: hypothetical protein OHK93_005321 [Ramalina farinacea]|uniref:Uncharacterized protein n=1 Tax=Ramalina farinacea TaxID=258253 RepID=A0AA43TVW3_9LECA|nr:hypothetical protein [Ramalina farinacea]